MDDDGTNILLENAPIHSLISNVKLYLEMESIFIQSAECESQHMGSESFTRVPTQKMTHCLIMLMPTMLIIHSHQVVNL